MTVHFLDTSALVKRYHSENGSVRIDSIFAEMDDRIVISRLGLVEIVSAFAHKARVGELDSADLLLCRQQVFSDVRKRVVYVKRMLVRHFLLADQLLLRYGLQRRLRTLDALQLAVAVEMREQGQIDSFVCADRALCQVAQLEGFSVVNPAESE